MVFFLLTKCWKGLCSLRRIFCKLGEVYLSEQLYEGTGKERVSSEFEQNQESLVAFALWVVFFQRELICWEKN